MHTCRRHLTATAAAPRAAPSGTSLKDSGEGKASQWAEDLAVHLAVLFAWKERRSDGPRITSFHPMSFRYNVDERSKATPGQGHCVCGVCTSCPCLHGTGTPCLPHLEDVHTTRLASLHCPSLRAWLCEWPCCGRVSCAERGPALHPEFPGEAPATCDPELE